MKANRIREALKVGLRVAKAEEILSYTAEKKLLQAAIKDCDDIFGSEGQELKAPPEHVKGEGLEAIMESLREVTRTGYEWQRLDFNLVLSNIEETPSLAESLKTNLHRMDMIVINVLQRLYLYQERCGDDRDPLKVYPELDKAISYDAIAARMRENGHPDEDLEFLGAMVASARKLARAAMTKYLPSLKKP